MWFGWWCGCYVTYTYVIVSAWLWSSLHVHRSLHGRWKTQSHRHSCLSDFSVAIHTEGIMHPKILAYWEWSTSCSYKSRAVNRVDVPFSMPKSIALCSVAEISTFSALAALVRRISWWGADLTDCSWSLVNWSDCSTIIFLNGVVITFKAFSWLSAVSTWFTMFRPPRQVVSDINCTRIFYMKVQYIHHVRNDTMHRRAPYSTTYTCTLYCVRVRNTNMEGLMSLKKKRKKEWLWIKKNIPQCIT